VTKVLAGGHVEHLHATQSEKGIKGNPFIYKMLKGFLNYKVYNHLD
jgi:hypothetical protein